MMKMSWLIIIATAFFAIASENDLVFHFDFSNAAGKNEITDLTGKFVAKSENRNFSVQMGALRSAPGARFYIPDTRLSQEHGTLSVMAWIMKKSTPEITPILSKGSHPSNIQFLFSVGWRYPQFAYKNQNIQSWKGIWYNGAFGTAIHYPDSKWLLPQSEFIESSGYWHHLAATFDHGVVKIYLNGKKILQNELAQQEFLQPSSEPFYIAAERAEGHDGNYITGNMLLNDLRLYSNVLSEDEINKIILAETNKYPKGSQIPAGKNHMDALPDCFDYYPPEYDPGLEKILNITAAFEKNRPSASIKSDKTWAFISTIDSIPRLLINGEKKLMVMGKPGRIDWLKWRLMIKEQAMLIRDFAAAGINLTSAGALPAFFWKGEGQYDFTHIDQAIGDVIRANPEAYIQFSISCVTPEWFAKKYPEELEKAYYGEQLRNVPPSSAGLLGSEKWVKAQSQMLSDVVSYIEAQDYGKHVFCYLIGGGQSAEWWWPGSVVGGLPGYSEATMQTFREWLKLHYQNDIAVLRASWKDPQVTFENALVPSPELRQFRKNGIYYDNVLQPVVDFRKYMIDQTWHNIETAAQSVKLACNGRKLTLIYFGYDLLGARHTVFNGGQLCTAKALNSPYINMLATPISYQTRRGGDSGLCINAFEASARLSKKIIWLEDDPRTHLSCEIQEGASRTLDETLAVQNRTVSQMLTRAIGGWWNLFDNAWYHQEEIIVNLSKNIKILEALQEHNRKSAAKAAIIFDEKSLLYWPLQKDGSFLTGHLWNLYEASVRSGTIFDYYFKEDILNEKMPPYKFYIFANLYEVMPEERVRIHEKLAKDHATAVWCYAAGYFDGKTASCENMSKLTGFDFNIVNNPSGDVVDTVKTERYGILPGARYAFSPQFYTIDGNAIVSKDQQGKGGVLSEKSMGDWHSIYSLMPLTSTHLRMLCKVSDVHLYSVEGDDMLLANDGMLMCHVKKRGDKQFFLPKKCNVTELYSNRLIGKNIDSFVEEDVAEASTLLYKLD